ncbi:MAG: hypothetical protein WBO17_02800 [Sphingorhabdus sp.]
MTPVLLVLVAAVLGWALWTKKISTEQLLPLVMGIAGAIIALRGNFFLGLVAVAVATAWYRGRTKRLLSTPEQSDQYAIDKARFLLGVSRFDDAERIRARHRILIAKDHPDTGGNPERATELNKARDLLLDELDKKKR